MASDYIATQDRERCPHCQRDFTSRGISRHRCRSADTATNVTATSPDETEVHDRIEEAPINIRWGNMTGLDEVQTEIQQAYNEITTWHKNIFELPRGKAGRDFITEATRLIQLFNNKTQWEPLAIHCLNIFMPIMLQKPSAKSKNKDHTKYLVKRLALWKEGKLKMLMSECREIQKRLKSSSQKKEEIIRGFTRLMMQGKVRQALKLIDSENDISGIHTLNAEIRQTLEAKHPTPEPIREVALAQDEITPVEDVIFEDIDFERVQRAAKNTSGSGGPTKIDADTWRHILCSKAYKIQSEGLAAEIASLARRLCTEDIQHDYISSLLSCRLVPLMKEDNGVRPVGVGETLRRIIGKCVTQVLKQDIQVSGGTLQMCTGVEAGIEAAIHAMQKSFNEDWCEAILLVDADNAFNRLNRKVALHNIQRTCSPLFRYLNNSYNTPAKLYLGDGSFLLSEEGVTQGDNLAMAMYALSTRPLINSLKETRGMDENFKQVWYADDSTGAGKLEKLKRWWQHLKEEGPAYGYFPKPTKTHLIVKNLEDLERAQLLFAGDGVKVTIDGERHIGAVVGSDEFRKEYIAKKVEKWVKDVEELTEIAKDEPQIALSAFNTGLSQRWKFVQRTVKDTGEFFNPLESAIRDKLIPAICGRSVSDIERRVVALPYRFGGLGIQNPTETASREYLSSRKITAGLTNLICDQDMDIKKLDTDAIKKTKAELKQEKDAVLKQEVDELLMQLDENKRRSLKAAQEKGASSWLAALPIKRLGYVLNKQEFRDGICLRYGWQVKNTPKFCACGENNTIDHILTCKKGGYVSMRHNALRDAEVKIMEEVCRDVKTEPQLMPIEREAVRGNNAPQARLDISAIGVWSQCEKTFLDVRVTHPNAVSHREKSLQQLYKQNENEKKKLYNDRIINVEKATFTPLIFTTTGGMGPECEKFNKRLAELISMKKKEAYSHVIGHIRTKLRFSLLRSILVAIRGIRGKISVNDRDAAEVSFNLIPQETCYETR